MDLLYQPRDVLDEVISLLTFKDQESLRCVCSKMKCMVDANAVFLGNRQLLVACGSNDYVRMVELVVGCKNRTDRMNLVSAFIAGKRTVELKPPRIPRKTIDKSPWIEFVTAMDLFLNGTKRIITSKERFLHVLATVATYDHVKVAAECELFDPGERMWYELMMSGAARGDNVPLFVALESQFKESGWPTTPGRLCASCSRTCACRFVSRLYWNVLLLYSIEGRSQKLVEHCFEMEKFDLEDVFDTYSTCLSTGDASFIRFYSEFIQSKGFENPLLVFASSNLDYEFRLIEMMSGAPSTKGQVRAALEEGSKQ